MTEQIENTSNASEGVQVNKKERESPFWEFYGYTAEEWYQRTRQERYLNPDWENSPFEYEWREDDK